MAPAAQPLAVSNSNPTVLLHHHGTCIWHYCQSASKRPADCHVFQSSGHCTPNPELTSAASLTAVNLCEGSMPGFPLTLAMGSLGRFISRALKKSLLPLATDMLNILINRSRCSIMILVSTTSSSLSVLAKLHSLPSSGKVNGT